MRINGKRHRLLGQGQLGHLSNGLLSKLYRSTCRKLTIICYEIGQLVEIKALV